MALEWQKRCLEVVLSVSGATVTATPDWLQRPGKLECGDRWGIVSAIYNRLTDSTLPDVMPAKERRSVDAVLARPGRRPVIFEFDETQHFNVHRLTTLEAYPRSAEVGFDLAAYKSACIAKKKLEGGGFAKPRPPLFPGEGGRHKQRAFRDALADLLPPLHGLGPTLRVAHFKVEGWLFSDSAEQRMRALLLARYPSD